MNNVNEIILNESNIPNSPFREEIVKEVHDYIGYSYSDDLNLNDYLTIDKITLKIANCRCYRGDVRDSNKAYYSMHNLISPGESSFTYKPNQPKIDTVVLDFFPIEKLSHFLDTVEKAIFDFISNHGIVADAVIGFPIDSFDANVYIPSELDTFTPEVEDCVDEDFLISSVDLIEVPMKNYIHVKNGEVQIDKHKLLILGLSHYIDS